MTDTERTTGTYTAVSRIDDLQPDSHPLKWEFLVDAVRRSGLTNPDVWIEDLRRYGPCRDGGDFCEPDVVGDDTDALEASFSTIIDENNNRIIIRHHY